MRTGHRLPAAARHLAILGLALALAACSGQSGTPSSATSAPASHVTALDPVYAEPRVGDLYSAEVSHFSAYDFGTGGTAYGMMRVIEVNDDKIVLHTETGAWPDSRSAIQELRGDLAGIEWHDGEKIQISRSELAQLVADKKILDVRRD